MTLNPGSRTLGALLCTCGLLLAALALHAGPQVTSAKGNRADYGLQVLAPVSYKNLTIFPVRGRDLPGSDAYITLDEGTKAGTVEGGVFYVIGPEKQLTAYEQYLKTVEGPDTHLFRIYPRDYWITSN